MDARMLLLYTLLAYGVCLPSASGGTSVSGGFILVVGISLNMVSSIILAGSCLLFVWVSNECVSGATEKKEEVIPKKSLLLLTVATERTDGYERFIRSTRQFNVEVEVLGMGEPWRGGDMSGAGGGYKINLLRSALNKYKDRSDLMVMFTDSYDVIVNANSEEILRRFDKYFPDARVVFSAEQFCWPNKELAPEYPLVKAGKRYLNSGIFMGYADELLSMIQWDSQDTDDDQLFYTLIFLKADLREKHKIELDSLSVLFQNLHGVEDDVELDFSDNNYVKVFNAAYNTKPVVLHGNGPSKQLALNYFGNYIGNSWNQAQGCIHCSESQLSLEAKSEFPLVTLAVVIAHGTPFMEEFLELLTALDYPKERMLLFLFNAERRHQADVEKFMTQAKKIYRETFYIKSAEVIGEMAARDQALLFCVKNNCDYLFMVDSDAHLSNPSTLKLLMQQNRGIITPMLIRPGKLWSSFWGSVSSTGYYERSDDYTALVHRTRLGVWNEPFIRYSYLIRADKLQKLQGAFSFDEAYDVAADMSFARFCRTHGYFMYVDNQYEYGKLINADDFESTRVHPELWEIFNNREVNMQSCLVSSTSCSTQKVFTTLCELLLQEFERRYIAPGLRSLVEAADASKFAQPCPDVYDFPLFTERFCWEIIEELEEFGEWSSGKNEDDRIQGGYENVPTRDIHMKQIDLERHYLYLLDEYVRPVQEIVYTGYYKRPLESHMMFVVRYRADEQPSLQPHHDASTFSIDVALNRRGIDFQGGGVNFTRYNCAVLDHEQGWSIMFPGRLTHLHEGLPTTKGTRYVHISFINP